MTKCTKKTMNTHKSDAIQTLKNIVHWMENSAFDYQKGTLREALSIATESYDKYLKQKKHERGAMVDRVRNSKKNN